jgi:hypothetical protein
MPQTPKGEILFKKEEAVSKVSFRNNHAEAQSTQRLVINSFILCDLLISA